jgi:non-ribosomal peptide synthetase component E (peptide arylation enzyme)
VLAAVHRDPEKIALAVLGPARAERWSYARLTRAVRGMAGALRARGLGPGDRVLLRLGNTVDFPVAFLGAVAADLVPVPTAAGLTEGEITRLARFVAPAAILAAPGIALPDLPGVPVLTELAAMMEHARLTSSRAIPTGWPISSSPPARRGSPRRWPMPIARSGRGA